MVSRSDFKVLLVYPNLQMINLLPTNIAVLAGYVKKAGFDVRVFDTTLYKTAEKSLDDIRVENLQLRPFNLKEKGVDYKDGDVFSDFVKAVEDYGPDVIGVSTTDDTYDLGMELVSKVREKNIFTVVGGVHATFAPDLVIENEDVDAVCVGEGEKALVELCEGLMNGEDVTGIPNLWVRNNGAVHKNDMRRLIDLDDLPFEDFTVFEEQRLYRPMQGKVYRMIPIAIDRGCPYSCSFCAAPSQRKKYRDAGLGNYVRFKSPERVIEELKYQVDTCKADYIYFNSETFFARPQRIIEAFAEEYKKQVGLPFWCQTNIETITEDRIRTLKDMNCDRMSIGLEHGNEEFRKKLLKKHFTNQQVIDGFKILGAFGIPITVNNIIGFPDETRKLAFDTIELNRQITADSINALVFVPYSGTPLREYCIEKGYVDANTKTDSLIKRSILNMPDFGPDKIMGLVRTFPLYIKMPKSRFADIEIAERFDDEGNEMYAKLREDYYRDYF